MPQLPQSPCPPGWEAPVGSYLGFTWKWRRSSTHWVLAAAVEPGREPGWMGGSCPRAGLVVGKPLVASPSLRLQIPLWGQRGPGTWSLGAWKSPPWVSIPGPTGTSAGQWPGDEGQGSGSDFPKEGTSPAVCIFGPLLEAPRVQGFIPPALWLLWWEDRFPDTPYRFPLHSLEPFPPVSSPLSLQNHETCVHICVSIYVCYVVWWG